MTDGFSDARGSNRWRGCLPVVLVVGLVMVVAIVLLLTGGSSSDDTTDGGGEQPVAAFPTSRAMFDVTAATGETFATTVHPAPTNTDRLLIAAPSRNVDEASLTPLIDELLRRDCASVITFDARPLTSTAPFDAYRAVVDALAEVYGFVGPHLATLGASFTGLAAVDAAAVSGASYAFALSPSQENPAPPPAGVMAQLIGAAGDVGFVDIYNQWADQGFDAFEFDSAKHGTAMFQNGVAADVVDHIADTFCR